MVFRRDHSMHARRVGAQDQLRIYARLLRCDDTDATGPRPFALGSAVPGFHVEAIEPRATECSMSRACGAASRTNAAVPSVQPSATMMISAGAGS